MAEDSQLIAQAEEMLAEAVARAGEAWGAASAWLSEAWTAAPAWLARLDGARNAAEGTLGWWVGLFDMPAWTSFGAYAVPALLLLTLLLCRAIFRLHLQE